MGDVTSAARRANEGVAIVPPSPLEDERGSFMRLFCTETLRNFLGGRQVVQINRSVTRQRGSVRGMHYQARPHAELKLIRCLRGKVFDVAVDLRRQSPTFLRWQAVELSEENDLMAVVPEGFAHGFQVLEPDSMLLYLHTSAYSADAERGIHPLDPAIGIPWPLPIGQLSDRDSRHAMIGADFAGIET